MSKVKIFAKLWILNSLAINHTTLFFLHKISIHTVEPLLDIQQEKHNHISAIMDEHKPANKFT